MKIKKLLHLTLCFLILTACQSRQEGSAQYREALENLQRDMVDKHMQYNLIQLQLQRLPLPGNVPLRTTNNDELPLADLLKQGPILIFRYSEVHCNSCTDLVIQKMNAWHEQGLTQTAIIASYDEYRHFTSFTRANRLKMPIYLLDQEAATGIFNTEIPPYLFLLDESMSVRYPFVPIKEMEEGIDMYLRFARDQLTNRASPLGYTDKVRK